MVNPKYRSLYREIVNVLKNNGIDIDSFEGNYDESINCLFGLVDDLYEVACEFNATPHMPISMDVSNDQ